LFDLQVIPITDAMREPRKFPAVLTGVMMGLLGKQWIPSSSIMLEALADTIGRVGWLEPQIIHRSDFFIVGLTTNQ